MEDTINLKKIDGKIVQVVTTTTTQEVPFDTEELKRQIEQHASILDNLQRQLHAVEAFVATEADEETVAVPEAATPSVIDSKVLENITKTEETQDATK